MRKIILFFVFVLIGVIIRAEDNYKKGYVITNSNDTIMGLIDFKMDKSNCEMCRFKLSEKDKVKVYHPYDISGYRLVDEKKYYVSRTITLDSIVKKVFLEYLVQGLKDLYFYQQDCGYYFLEGDNGKMIELSKQPDQIVDNKMVVDDHYKGKLMYAFKDCAGLRKNIEKGRFDRKTMVELTKKYHEQQCTTGEECIVFENDYKKRFTRVDLIVYAGIENTKMTFDNADKGLFPVTSQSPVVGVEFCINDPRVSKSFSLLVDISMSKHNLVKDVALGYDGSSGSARFKVKGYQPSLSTGIRYTIFKGCISPFIDAGVGFSSLGGTSSSFKGIYTNKQSTEVIDETVYCPYDSYRLYSYNVGAGCNFRINDKHYIYWGMNYNKSVNTELGLALIQMKLGFAF